MRLLRSLLVVVPGLLFACSSGGSSSGGAATSDGFAQQYCELFAPCCASAGLPSDGAQCRALIVAFGGSGKYDAAAGEACLADMRAASAKPGFCESGGNTGSSACQQVFSGSGSGGTRAPGETCDKESDCAPSTEGEVRCASRSSGGATVKQCQVMIAGKEGDSPCIGTVEGNVTYYSYSGTDTEIPTKGYLCAVKDGLRCDGGKCTKIPALGEPCGGASPQCASNAYCDSTSGNCAPKKAVGEACEEFRDQCQEGTYCDSASKKCTTALADGAPCTNSNTCASNSCVNGKCEKSGSDDFGLTFICGGG